MDGDIISQEINPIKNEISNKKKILIISIASAVLITIIITGIFLFSGSDEISQKTEEKIEILRDIKNNKTAQRLIVQPLIKEVKTSEGIIPNILLRLKNNLEENQNATFSYKLTMGEPKSSNKCEFSQENFKNFFPKGTSLEIGPINASRDYMEKLLVNPVGQSNCVFRINIEVMQSESIYASNYMDVFIE